MPKVEVLYKKSSEGFGRGGQFCLSFLQESLPFIIATGLNVPGNRAATLSPDEIEVSFRERSTFDVSTNDFDITVFANYFPERAKNLQTRTQDIERRLATGLSKARIAPAYVVLFSVYVRLANAGFVEGHTDRP